MKRRLVIRPGAIGDLVASLPALEYLKAESGYLEVWCASQNVPLVLFAGRVAAISSTGIDWVGLEGVEPPPSVLRTLAGFDDIVSWYGSNRPAFREAVRGFPIRFLAALPPEDGNVHAADFYLRQVGGTGIAVPRILCSAAKGDFAVIHPFSGSKRKNWPLERFRAVAAWLERRKIPVRWCAGPEEDLPAAIRIRDIYDLACWLSQARLFIGNDSGISHLAAAAGAPVLALFGASDPAIWAPRGPSVRVISAASLEDIDVGQVTLAAGALL